MSRVLLVSLGSIGQRHLRNTRELLPDAEIAVYRTHFKADAGLPEAADRVIHDQAGALEFAPDAVIISSPACDHVRHALDFLRAGAHLFVEKPLAVSHDEVSELVSAAQASKCFAMVGYVLRFQPIMRFIRDYLHSGELGEILTANVQVGQYLPDWRPDSDYRVGVSAQQKLGGGALLELSHELDYSSWWFGLPEKVLCSSGKLSDLEIDVEDSACVIMEYGQNDLAGRVVVQVDFLQRAANMEVQVVGSQGTLYADLIKEQVYCVSPGQNDIEYLDAPRMETGNELYLRQFDFFFANSIDGYSPRFDETTGYDHHVSIEHAADVLRLVDLAKESSRSGQRMDYGI